MIDAEYMADNENNSKVLKMSANFNPVTTAWSAREQQHMCRRMITLSSVFLILTGREQQ